MDEMEIQDLLEQTATDFNESFKERNTRILISDNS